MSFSNFLNESKYKTEINKDEIIRIFKSHCKNSDPKYPLYRGMRGTNDGYVLEGQNGNRRSINNTNHYTIAIDYFLKKKGNDIPLRSKSIIVGSNDMMDEVEKYGSDIYAIFPYDNVKFGVVPDYDIWGIRFSVNGNLTSLTRLNSLYDDANISDEDYHTFNRDLKKYIKDHKDDENDKLVKYFVDEDDVDSTLRDIYDTEMDFVFKDSRELKHIKSKEIWIGGKCLAIKLDLYNEILEDL